MSGGTQFLCDAIPIAYLLYALIDRGLNLSTYKATSKEWKFPSAIEIEQSIVEAADGSKILAELLVRRGLTTVADVKAFLDPAEFSASSPMELPDMARAVARITQAIATKEKITVYGDYDVDGVTATAVMVTTLRTLGADVDFYIPSRSEGYGLNLKAISVLASKHRTKLIITCDCGISNFSEINFARSLKVDTIVTDHHTMPELLPPAAATLHPKQLHEDHPLYHLPGVGVAYKLSEALLLDANHPVEQIDKLLDFVTLGMIADMVPLTRECRYLVQVGMPFLVNSERAGIRALLGQLSPQSQGTDLVGFGLAPRINAVGRLSDANLAVRLMITDDQEEASKLAMQLELDNLRRQELCEKIFLQADLAAAARIKTGDKAIAIYDVDWHHGVVGIVASRLVEKYHCPVFIGELNADEGIVKGSARGISGIDLYEVLKANEHLALKWGGHKMAAGFSVEMDKAPLFCKSIVETCNKILADTNLRPTLDIDLVLDPSVVTLQLAETISRLAPFGMANKKPVIAIQGGECASTRTLGKEGKHHRLNVACADGTQFECVFWNSRGRIPYDGQAADIAFAPELNTYNGNTRLQLVLSDWRDPAEPVLDFAPPVVAQQALPAGSEKQSFAPPASVKLPSADSRSTALSAQQAQPANSQSFAPPSERAAKNERPVTTEHAASERTVSWKDLRNHAAPQSLIEAALRKLGAAISIYAEAAPKISNVDLHDRNAVPTTQHLIIWQYPPNLQVFKQVLASTNAQHIYHVGGSQAPADDANGFIRKLLGLVRFAVNQREGQAEAEKIAAALATTKMCVALGLTVLKKIEVIDWFAEDGLVFLELIGQPVGKTEEIPEFKQLTQCLREVAEFREWCQTASIDEIQLALVPTNGTSEAAPTTMGAEQRVEENFSGIPHNDTASNLSAPYTG